MVLVPRHNRNEWFCCKGNRISLEWQLHFDALLWYATVLWVTNRTDQDEWENHEHLQSTQQIYKRFGKAKIAETFAWGNLRNLSSGIKGKAYQ